MGYHEGRILGMTQLATILAPEPMAHRPPLRGRFWVYSAVAYLAPVLVQVVWPENESVGDELVWLVTLVPAFLLSLHYGLRGALVGLTLGTTLFAVVQAVLAANFVPDDWRITMPIWVAYGTLAVSVGWLSEELHTFYRRALRSERLAAIGEAALALRHELSDALSVVSVQTEILTSDRTPEPNREEALRLIREATDDAARVLKELTRVSRPPPTLHYSTGDSALDLRRVVPPGGS
jgi:signal transduction histidine kinase